MSQEFRIGLHVQQIAGGPVMLVTDTKEGDGVRMIVCSWLDGGRQKEAEFLADELAIINPPNTGGAQIVTARRRGKR
jgi:uncharacterized protein YodC (DUF2158 family)